MKFVNRKAVYTTGEVAKICSVAPRTVSKWFDKGLLKGYRIPDSQDRRIPHYHLMTFMQEHGIPLEKLRGTSGFNILLVGCSDSELKLAGENVSPTEKFIEDRQLQNQLENKLHIKGNVTVREIHSIFDLGGIFAKKIDHPNVVIYDVSMGRSEVLQAFVSVQKRCADVTPPQQWVIIGEDANQEEYQQFHQVFKRPFDPELLRNHAWWEAVQFTIMNGF